MLGASLFAVTVVKSPHRSLTVGRSTDQAVLGMQNTKIAIHSGRPQKPSLSEGVLWQYLLIKR
jgi:hypothetical protein